MISLNKAFIILCFTVLSIVVICNISENNIWFKRNTTSILPVDDIVPFVADLQPPSNSNSIYFHETSFLGGISTRQACSIESAARIHPDRQIYVLFSGKITKLISNRSLSVIQSMQNVYVARIVLKEYSKNTPLEELVSRNPFNESQWKVEHTSDVLRCLTLYKWGGVYLDTDMLVTKPLTPLGLNWVGRENPTFLNSAAIAISKDKTGQKYAESWANELRTTYRPDLWAHNGPGAITRVLQKLCTTTNLDDWSSKTCEGFEVYGPEYFYPIPYTNKEVYFKAGDLGEEANQAYAFHFWNKLTYDMKIEKDSPYAKMAEKFCPTIYEMYGDEFGV